MTFLEYIPMGCEELRESIERVDCRPDVALVLLIHYGWNSDLVDQELASKEEMDAALEGIQLQTFLGRSVYTNLSLVECVRCGELSHCVRTDCSHCLCRECVVDSVVNGIEDMQRLPLCPSCDQYYLNPALIAQFLPVDISSLYFQSLQMDLVANHVDPYVDRERFLLFTLVSFYAGLVMFGCIICYWWRKFKAWKLRNPQLLRLCDDVYTLWTEGEPIDDVGFWKKVAKKSLWRQLEKVRQAAWRKIRSLF